MATQLTLVNNVLRRLREDEVTSVADNAYAQLLAMYVSDGIDDVTAAYDWSSLRHTINVDLVDGTREYDLSATVAESGNVDNADRVTTLESLLLFVDGASMAFLYDDASDVDTNINMRYLTPDQLEWRYRQDTSEANVDPCCFTLMQSTDGDGYSLKIWPEPDAARRIRISFWTPQAELTIDGTDDATDIIVPNSIVEAYAHMTASNERGEEIGEPGNLLERRYQNRMGAFIEAAMSADVRANRYESVRD